MVNIIMNCGFKPKEGMFYHRKRWPINGNKITDEDVHRRWVDRKDQELEKTILELAAMDEISIDAIESVEVYRYAC